MWFKFPDGATEVSVQLQNFKIEATDKDGPDYFRAPNHFASIILGLPGFSTGEPPEGAPDDLPVPDPMRDGAISDLSHEVSRLKQETSDARADVVAMRSSLLAMTNERNDLRRQLELAQAKLKELEEEEEELPLDEVVPLATKVSKK